MTPTARRTALWLAAAVCVAVFAWNASQTWSSVVDDAYISARYAENLADGHGLVYSADEPPVEGYTNLLWTVLVGLGRVVGLPILHLMTGLGFLFGVITLAFTVGIARQLGGEPGTGRGAASVAVPLLAAGAAALAVGLPVAAVLGATIAAIAVLVVAALVSTRASSAPAGLDPAIAIAPAFAIALSPHFAVASTNGIESSMMAAMVTGTVWAHLALRDDDRSARAGRHRWVAGLLAAALVLTRPEGALIAGLVCVHDLWLHRRSPKGALPLTGVATVAVIALFSWRFATYGALLPNTWYAKSSFDLPETFSVNRNYLVENRSALLGLGALWALAAVLPPYRVDKALVSLLALVLGVVPLSVNLWMPGLRLYLPTGALVAALFAAALLRAPRALGRVGAVAGVVGMAVYLGLGGHRVRAYDGRHTVQPGNGTEIAARHLASHAPDEGDVWLATRDAGVFAYYVGTDVKVAELHQRALTQPHPDGKNSDVRTFTPTNPAFFAGTVQRADAKDFAYGNDRAIFRRATMPYVYLGRVQQHYHRYYDVYARADLHVPPLPKEVVVNMAGPPPPIPATDETASLAEPLPDTGL